MLTKPSQMAVRALYSLSKHTGWPEINGFLNSELDATFKVLSEAADEATLRQMQGRAQFIRELLTMVQDAPKILEKLGGHAGL